MQLNELVSLYRRFSNYIKKNYEKFDQVFIIVPIEEKYSKNHLLTISDLKWSLVDKFYSGQIEIGLYGLADKFKSVVSSVSKINLPSVKKEEPNALEFPRTTEVPAPPTVIPLPTHLVPKRPKNAKKRVLWRRKVHALRLSY
jgi:hypothetical protein